MKKPEGIPSLRMTDFQYDLPLERIAERPLPDRDMSRLLVYDGRSRTIEHRAFRDVAHILPAGSMLVVNRTRVVAARLVAQKPTGGKAEVLLTDPVRPSSDPQVVLMSLEPSEWHCLLGGRNIAVGTVLQAGPMRATVLERSGSEGMVRLEWDDKATLSEMLHAVGHVPLPPYIKRDDDADDTHRYQTVFARSEGSVAAPTAGLHFTEAVLADLASHGIKREEVTLHVGLGTFQPVHVDDAADHVMHGERIEIDRAALKNIVEHLRSPQPWITVVGTTSLRTIESLYWFGCRLLDGEQHDRIVCEQWDAFAATNTNETDPAAPACLPADALAAVLEWMDGRGLASAWGVTHLMLAPECSINVASALITNFHQPGNTLLMLVAAITDGEEWRRIYATALDEGYRMLSYGDSSLIIRAEARS